MVCAWYAYYVYVRQSLWHRGALFILMRFYIYSKLLHILFLYFILILHFSLLITRNKVAQSKDFRAMLVRANFTSYCIYSYSFVEEFLINSGCIIIEKSKLYDKIQHHNHRWIDCFFKRTWKDNIMEAQHPLWIFYKTLQGIDNCTLYLVISYTVIHV